MIDIASVRNEFPILKREVHKHPLIYLDNAATTQKPRCVVNSIVNQYYNTNANVHRGVHALSQQSTELFEGARMKIARFINAQSVKEVIFTRGTTDSINALAYSFGESFLKAGDEIILTAMEHHSNIVPWQLLASRKGLRLRIVPLTEQCTLDWKKYVELFSSRTRLVCITHVSNVLGVVNPVKQMIATAHAQGVPVLIDGAQAVAHRTVDVCDLDADFYAFSGHKMYGPTGVGVLYGKERWLEKMTPYQGGGEMIQNVSFARTTFNELPYKFEAGTPDYVGAAALGAAVDFIDRLGMDQIAAHEQQLMTSAVDQLLSIPKVHLFGDRMERSGVLSLWVDGIHHLDIGTLLDQLGVAVRTGHHCAEPLMQQLKVEGTVRVSFGVYNNQDDVDALCSALRQVITMF